MNATSFSSFFILGLNRLRLVAAAASVVRDGIVWLVSSLASNKSRNRSDLIDEQHNEKGEKPVPCKLPRKVRSQRDDRLPTRNDERAVEPEGTGFAESHVVGNVVRSTWNE